MSEGPKESGAQAGTSYLSYLLRMWSMPGEGAAEKWLASLESPLTREQLHFAELETLFAFLRTMTGQTGYLASTPTSTSRDFNSSGGRQNEKILPKKE